jgi:LptD protein
MRPLRLDAGMVRLFCIVFCCFWVQISRLSAQEPARNPRPLLDSIPNPPRDSAVVDLSNQQRIRVSNEGLDEIIDYGSRDSMWFDVKNQQLHLYGEAFVKYTSLDVKAGYILMDYGKNEVVADQLADSLGTMQGKPEFKDGEQSFSASKLRYNFKSKKGIIYEARTKQEDLYVLGERAKFVGAAVVDTSQKSRNTIYNSDALLTTCDAEHPHYGIRSKKLKIIPDKLVVTGLSNLELGGVPTPLILPFGFFPISKTRKAGILIPRDYDLRSAEGVGVEGLGWYQPINQHMDATLTMRAYTRGTIGLQGSLRYNRRYHYTGDLQLRYDNRVLENSFAERVPNRSWGLTLSHNQDSKAHPTRRFGGSLNIQTNQNQRTNRNDFASVYQNQLRSNLTYSQVFPGKPYSFNASLTHSQNVQTRQMDISLPNLNFQMQQINPFKRKVQVGKERWYEKLTLGYDSKFVNTFRTVDTLLFTRKTLENAQMGIQHNARTSVALKVLKFINISPNASFEENWYPYTIRKDLLNEVRLKTKEVRDPETNEIVAIEVDSVNSQFGIDTSYRVWGFKAFRTYNAGVSANTILFFTKQFKKGWFRGIRHKMTPTIGTGFGPDFTNPRYDYFKLVQTDLRPLKNDTIRYGIFDENIFGRPGYNPRRMAINWGINNVLEMKYKGKNDSLAKKIRIFDNLSLSGTYSLTDDTLKWSTVSTGGVFRLFKGLSTLNWGVSFDPYISADAKGKRINKFELKENNRIARLTRLGLTLNTGFTLAQIRDAFKKKDADQVAAGPPNNTAKGDQFIDWFNQFSVNHYFELERSRRPIGYNEYKDTLVVRGHNLGINGSIPLNSKWSIDLRNISYDFVSKSLVYPDLAISRDLHCWQLSLSWQPERGSYLFNINVKPGTLEFLKIPYRKTPFDGSRF